MPPTDQGCVPMAKLSRQAGAVSYSYLYILQCTTDARCLTSTVLPRHTAIREKRERQPDQLAFYRTCPSAYQHIYTYVNSALPEAATLDERTIPIRMQLRSTMPQVPPARTSLRIIRCLITSAGLLAGTHTHDCVPSQTFSRNEFDK